MLTLISHEDPRWNAIYRSHGRENGAATYSREIVQFQVPVWEEELPGADITISTCPLVYGERGSTTPRKLPGGDVLVQYLHEWRLTDSTQNHHKLARHFRNKYGSVVFVTAYKPLQHQMEQEGLDAIYLPMSIDVERVTPYRREPETDGLVYFGNIKGKLTAYVALEGALEFTHVKMKQPEAWAELSRFRYGIGVGRCAMEMAALGMRVLIYGRTYGGIVQDHGHYLAQQGVNFNGRIVTGPHTLFDGLSLLPEAMLWTPMDSREAVEWLRTGIWEKFSGYPLHLPRGRE